MSSLFLRVACKTEHTPVHVGYRSGGIKSARSCEYVAYNISPCRFLPPLVAQAAGESRQTIGPPQCMSCYNIQLFGIRCVCVCVCVRMIITYSKSMDQPGKVAIPARGQLNKEN